MKLKSPSFSFDASFPRSKYSDVELSTSDGAGRDIKAHKVVLAAVTVKLEKLIDSAGDGVGPVIVRNIRFEVLEKIVDFIYIGNVEVEDADVEDFQDGLDMLRIRVNEEVDQNGTLQSINIPLIKVGNIPVREVANVPPQSFLPTPTSHEDDQVKVLNNLPVSSNPRNVSYSSEAVHDNNTEEIPEKNPKKFAACGDAQPRSRLSSISSSDSENTPLNSTPLINIPETSSYSSPTVSSISVAVRKLQKYRRQAESVTADSDSESVAPPIMKVINPCYAISEVSDAESETDLEKDDPPPPDYNMNNISSGDSIIKHNVSNLEKSVIKCPLCDNQISYKKLSKHYKRKHPEVVKSSKKIVCNVCRKIVPSYSYELHLKVYHLEEVGIDKLKNQKLELPGQLLSRYEVFFEDVPEEGVERRKSRVRCLLCGDGQLLLKRNFGKHFGRTHETLVMCHSCGRKFNGEQIKKHTKLCPSRNAKVSRKCFERTSKTEVCHG